MPVKFDTSVIVFLSVVFILLGISMALKYRSNRVLKLVFRIATGGIFLFILNWVGAMFNFELPLNLITALITGVFQIPGIAFLIIMKYFIYP